MGSTLLYGPISVWGSRSVRSAALIKALNECNSWREKNLKLCNKKKEKKPLDPINMRSASQKKI